MAFTFTKDLDWVDRGVRHTGGSFTSTAGSVGGDVYTGLQTIDGTELQHSGDAVVADCPTVNESFPCHDPVSIVTTATKVGYWHAFGS
jgi:hypothetical protein